MAQKDLSWGTYQLMETLKHITQAGSVNALPTQKGRQGEKGGW